MHNVDRSKRYKLSYLACYIFLRILAKIRSCGTRTWFHLYTFKFLVKWCRIHIVNNPKLILIKALRIDSWIRSIILSYVIDQDSFGMKNTLFTILSTNNSTTQESRIINERIETKTPNTRIFIFLGYQVNL